LTHTIVCLFENQMIDYKREHFPDDRRIITVNKINGEKVANAYNVIALMENLDTINPEDIAYNYRAEMFLEPVLNEIL